MSPLIRLFPAAWRDRYGDEFQALLQDVRITPFDLIDVLLAAMDAHLRPQVALAAAYSGEEILVSRSQYGYAAITGGLALGLLFASSMLLPEPLREVVLVVAYPIAAVSLLLALAGLSPAAARRRRTGAWLAFALPVAGLLVSLAGIGLMALLHDRPLVGSISPYYVFALGVVGFLAGSVIFAADGLLNGSLGRAGAVAIAIGAVSAAISMSILLLAWSPTPALPLVLAYHGGGLLYSAGWLWLGYGATRQSLHAAPKAI